MVQFQDESYVHFAVADSHQNPNRDKKCLQLFCVSQRTSAHMVFIGKTLRLTDRSIRKAIKHAWQLGEIEKDQSSESPYIISVICNGSF